jgi:hypothetical protein
MDTFTTQELPLPADQAFVVQFARVTDRTRREARDTWNISSPAKPRTLPHGRNCKGS